MPQDLTSKSIALPTLETTEGRRDDSGKAKLHLVPREPLEEVSRAFQNGMEKYGKNNWRQGMNWTRYSDAAERHLGRWLEGEERAADSGVHHLAHAVANLMMLLQSIQSSLGVDDRAQSVASPMFLATTSTQTKPENSSQGRTCRQSASDVRNATEGWRDDY